MKKESRSLRGKEISSSKEKKISEEKASLLKKELDASTKVNKTIGF